MNAISRLDRVQETVHAIQPEVKKAMWEKCLQFQGTEICKPGRIINRWAGRAVCFLHPKSAYDDSLKPMSAICGGAGMQASGKGNSATAAAAERRGLNSPSPSFPEGLGSLLNFYYRWLNRVLLHKNNQPSCNLLPFDSSRDSVNLFGATVGRDGLVE